MAMVSGVKYLVWYNRDAVLKWVDSGGLFVSRYLHGERSETETAPAEDIYVRPAVFEDLGLEVKRVIAMLHGTTEQKAFLESGL